MKPGPTSCSVARLKFLICSLCSSDDNGDGDNVGDDDVDDEDALLRMGGLVTSSPTGET